MSQTETSFTNLSTDLISFLRSEIVLRNDPPLEAETDLLLTGLVDSLGVIRVVQWLEDRLHIQIDPADVVLEHFQTVDLMMSYLQHREP
jgi:acyl carrier protein